MAKAAARAQPERGLRQLETRQRALGVHHAAEAMLVKKPAHPHPRSRSFRRVPRGCGTKARPVTPTRSRWGRWRQQVRATLPGCRRQPTASHLSPAKRIASRESVHLTCSWTHRANRWPSCAAWTMPWASKCHDGLHSATSATNKTCSRADFQFDKFCKRKRESEKRAGSANVVCAGAAGASTPLVGGCARPRQECDAASKSRVRMVWCRQVCVAAAPTPPAEPRRRNVGSEGVLRGVAGQVRHVSTQTLEWPIYGIRAAWRTH